MPSIAENLIAREEVVFESRKHWIAPVRDSLLPAGLIVLAGILTLILPTGEGLLQFLWTILGLVRWGLLLAGIGWIAYNVVVWRTAQFAVTNLRVLRYEGLVQRRTSETLLSSVTDVKLAVGLLGKRLGYGDLRIFTQSGDAGADSFTSITEPAEFRNAMMRLKIEDQLAARPAAAPAAFVAPAAQAHAAAAPSPSTADDQAARLLRLAELRDRGIISPEEFEAKKTEILARL